MQTMSWPVTALVDEMLEQSLPARSVNHKFPGGLP